MFPKKRLRLGLRVYMKEIVQCVEKFKALYDKFSKDFEDRVMNEMMWTIEQCFIWRGPVPRTQEGRQYDLRRWNETC
jgi:hypothetical protein